jgi:hypothetical protein
MIMIEYKAGQRNRQCTYAYQLVYLLECKVHLWTCNVHSNKCIRDTKLTQVHLRVHRTRIKYQYLDLQMYILNPKNVHLLIIQSW